MIDDQTPNLAFGTVLDLARSERLSAYDASYLKLAMRRGLPLATKDKWAGAGVPGVWASPCCRPQELPMALDHGTARSGGECGGRPFPHATAPRPRR